MQEEDANFEGPEDWETDNEGSGGEGSPAGFQAVNQRLYADSGTQDEERDAQSVQKLLEEYNSLEYEDIVAGVPTKFHYQKVSSDFGINLQSNLRIYA